MKKWDPNFGPSYTPKEMLDQGIFEGIYTAAIKSIPAEYKNHPKVLKRGSEPDNGINRYKVKSRQSLKEWERKGWTTELSPLGWWEWYIKYFHGRRDEKEDNLQISRWRSFVARHQGQIKANCKLGDHDCRPKQRQGLLQWGWDSATEFTPKRIESNAKRLAKMSGATLEESKVVHENLKKSNTYIYLYDPSGMALMDALAHADEIGNVDVAVLKPEISSAVDSHAAYGVKEFLVELDNLDRPVKDKVETVIDNNVVLYIDFPLPAETINYLNSKYTVYPTDTQMPTN